MVPNGKLRKICKKLIGIAYPDYKGRKIYFETKNEIDISDNFWDGGTRSYYVFIRGDGKQYVVQASNPFKDKPDQKVTLEQGLICVTHKFFCGHDCGCTVIIPIADRLLLESD